MAKRNCKKNERPMQYALYNDKIPILDEHGDDTFDTRQGYDNPITFSASLSAGKSDAEESPFGTNVSYDRVICTCDMKLPVDENSIIWVKNTPIFNEDGSVNGDSADYRVSARPLDGLFNLRIAVKNNTK